MSTVLSNGVIVPDVGSTNWASDLETNWTLLNALIGAVGANVRLDRPNIWTAAQTFSEGIYGDLDGTAAMAVNDANGNEIATTYALKTNVTSLQTAVTDLQTAVSGKAADNAVVHLAGAETISGDKTWTGINAFTNPVHAVTNQSVPITENPSAEIVGNNFRFIDNDRFWGQFVPVWGTDGSFRIELGISNWTTTGGQGYWAVGTKVSKDFGTLDFYTSHNNANLGTSTNKWKTLNGVNPGALSFPNNSAYIDISSSISDRAYGANSFVAAATGWIAIGSFATAIQIADDTTGMAITGLPGSDGYSSVFLPVRANDNIRVLINQTSTTFQTFRLLPCLGNV